jgi:hypothetical protein
MDNTKRLITSLVISGFLGGTLVLLAAATARAQSGPPLWQQNQPHATLKPDQEVVRSTAIQISLPIATLSHCNFNGLALTGL